MDRLVDWNKLIDTNNIAVDANAHLDIVKEWTFKIALPVVLFTSVCVAVFLLAITSGAHWAIIGGFLCAAVGGVAAFIVGLYSFDLAQGVLTRRCNQWQADKQAIREFQQSQIENEKAMRLTIKDGGVANINPEVVNQMIVGDSKDLQRFIKHRREFLERVKELRQADAGGVVTGTERNTWLKATVDGKPYKWFDGTRIGKGEYEYLLETLEGTVYEPLERRQGTRGKRQDVITTPLLDTGEGLEPQFERNKSSKTSQTSRGYKIIGDDST